MKNQTGLIAVGLCLVVATVALGLFVFSSYHDAPTDGDGVPTSETPQQEDDLNVQPAPDVSLPEGQDVGSEEPEDGQTPPPGEAGDSVEEGINQVRVAPDGTGVVAGLAPPGSTVNLYNKGVAVGTTGSSEQGDWVVAIDPPLGPGSHLLHVEIVTPEGETRVGGLAAVVELTGRNETPLVALVPYTEGAVDDGASPELLQSPDGGEGTVGQQALPGVNIRTIQTTQQGTRVQVAGDALGGTTVILDINGETTPAVPVAEDAYVVEAGLDPAAARHRLKVTLLDAGGNAIASARVALTRSKIEQTLGNDSLVVVQKGDALWRIAYSTYGDGFRYVTIFERNRDQIANADLIYPDQIFVVPDE